MKRISQIKIKNFKAFQLLQNVPSAIPGIWARSSISCASSRISLIMRTASLGIRSMANFRRTSSRAGYSAAMPNNRPARAKGQTVLIIDHSVSAMLREYAAVQA
jgi:hypothetical protein